MRTVWCTSVTCSRSAACYTSRARAPGTCCTSPTRARPARSWRTEVRPVLLRVRNVRAIENLEIHLRRFSMLIGANNGGKSAVLEAILLFYGELVWERRRDLPWTALPPLESWVEVEYELADDEAEELRDHADGGVLRV